jgi:hypothetical protein
MTDAVRFDIVDDDSSSLQRARDTPVEVVHDPQGDSYLIAFEDSDDVHEVEMSRHTDGWRADCWMLDESGKRTGRCRGWVHHDGPCAHLWAVRSQLAHDRLEDANRRHDLDDEQVVYTVGSGGELVELRATGVDAEEAEPGTSYDVGYRIDSAEHFADQERDVFRQQRRANTTHTTFQAT